MTESTIIPIKDSVAENAWVDETKYFKMYEQSVSDPEGFWKEQALSLIHI